MNSTKILIVAKYFYDDSMLKALIRHLKKLSQLDTFFFKNSERPRSLKNSINLRFKKKIRKEKYDIVIIWNNILLDEELDLINKNTITFGILNGFSCLNSFYHINQSDFFNLLRKYNFYLISQKNYVDKLINQKINAVHFNFFSDPCVYKPTKIRNLTDIGFIGNVDLEWSKDRYDNLKYIQNKKNYDLNVISNKKIKIQGIRNFPKLRYEFLVNYFFNLNRINLAFDNLPSLEPFNHMRNIIIPYQDKFVSRVRNFNILMSRSCLIVEDHADMNHLFNNNSEIITWRNQDELCDKIERSLKDKNFRTKIENNGYLNCLHNHSIFNRLIEIQKLLEKKIFDFDINKILMKNKFY